jgi:hypothetical protein
MAAQVSYAGGAKAATSYSLLALAMIVSIGLVVVWAYAS